MEALVTGLHHFFSAELTVMLTAAVPVIELRGAIPVGISLGLTPLHATVVAFIGSMLPAPLILYTARPVFGYLKTIKFFRKLVNKLTDRSLNFSSKKIEKYGTWGLLLLVAMPIPGTGVWSGSLVAALLGMRFRLAFPAILAGNLIAGLLILGVSEGVFKIIGG